MWVFSLPLVLSRCGLQSSARLSMWVNSPVIQWSSLLHSYNPAQCIRLYARPQGNNEKNTVCGMGYNILRRLFEVLLVCTTHPHLLKWLKPQSLNYLWKWAGRCRGGTNTVQPLPMNVIQQHLEMAEQAPSKMPELMWSHTTECGPNWDSVRRSLFSLSHTCAQGCIHYNLLLPVTWSTYLNLKKCTRLNT